MATELKHDNIENNSVSASLQKIEFLSNQQMDGDKIKALIDELTKLLNQVSSLQFSEDAYNDEKNIPHILSRIVSCWLRIIYDESLGFDRNGLFCLANVSGTVQQIFEITSFNTQSYIFKYFFDKGRLTQLQSRKLISMLTLANVPQFFLDNFNNFPVDVRTDIGLILAATFEPYSSGSDTKFALLLKVLETTEFELTSNEQFRFVLSAYFRCSYSNLPEKHNIKIKLNNSIQKYIGKMGIKAGLLAKLKKHKKQRTILIIVDQFTFSHAMFRCHGSNIARLKEQFHVVLVHNPGMVDDVTLKVCDESYQFEAIRGNLKEAIGTLRAYEPDIVYFPSIGMTPLTIVMSNVRLAPIQVMSLGHPATTKSPFIDYVLSNPLSFSGNESLYSEKNILMEETISKNILHPDFQHLAPKPIDNDKIVMGINANAVKINSRLIDICAEAMNKRNGSVRTKVFANASVVMHLHLNKVLQAKSEYFEIITRRTYPKYMCELNKCDFILGTFPFGGTNSYVDAYLLGKPVLVMHGDEPHSYFDVSFIREYGTSDFCVAYTEDEYSNKVEEMLDKPDKIAELSRDITDRKPLQFFVGESEKVAGHYLDVFNGLIRNYGIMSKSSERVFKAIDIIDDSIV